MRDADTSGEFDHEETGMKPRESVTDGGSDHRPRGRQREPSLAIGREDPLADHHVEEVLALLNALHAAKAPVMATN